MFKIRVVAQESLKRRPTVFTRLYHGDSPDIFVRDLLKNLLFDHGFRRVVVSIVLVTVKYEQTREKIMVEMDWSRR
jgi:hypothetical protein